MGTLTILPSVKVIESPEEDPDPFHTVPLTNRSPPSFLRTLLSSTCPRLTFLTPWTCHPPTDTATRSRLLLTTTSSPTLATMSLKSNSTLLRSSTPLRDTEKFEDLTHSHVLKKRENYYSCIR